MSENEKWVWIIAGPNGAGKTSIRSHLPPEIGTLPHFDPDQIAANAPITADPGADSNKDSTTQRYLNAQRRIQNGINQNIASGTSFSIETTIPGSQVYGYSFSDLRGLGYKIGVVAVGVDSMETLQNRGQTRQKNGGHAAEKMAIEVSWAMNPEFIAKAMQNANQFMLYDNSGPAPVLVASKTSQYAKPLAHALAPNAYSATLLQKTLNGNQPQTVGRY